MSPLRGSDEGCTCKPKATPWAELGQPFGPKPACADLQHFHNRCRISVSFDFYNLRKTTCKDLRGSRSR